MTHTVIKIMTAMSIHSVLIMNDIKMIIMRSQEETTTTHITTVLMLWPDIMENPTKSRVQKKEMINRLIMTTTQTIASSPTTKTNQKAAEDPRMTMNQKIVVLTVMIKMIHMITIHMMNERKTPG